jgi:quercetin dioxygenase-like cupin family protein
MTEERVSVAAEGGETILVVDDDKAFCQALALALRRRGFKVIVAHDVEEGLSEARAFRPERVVVDLRMSGANGLDLRLAAAYGTTVLDLFGHPKRPSRLVGPKDRRSLQTHSGVRMEVLSQGTMMLQCMMFRVSPGSGSDGAYSHSGEEFIYMLEGMLEVWLDEVECHTLETGDSFWFESTLGHRWYNPGRQDAVLIWINTPPTF